MICIQVTNCKGDSTSKYLDPAGTAATGTVSNWLEPRQKQRKGCTRQMLNSSLKARLCGFFLATQTCYRQNMSKFESAHIGAQGFNFLKMSKFEPLTGPSGLSLPIHVCMPEVLWKFPVCEPIDTKN